MIGETDIEVTVLENEIEKAKGQVEAWMTSYRKNRWENQDYYVEVFIEKKALQGIFQQPCARAQVALGACKGYPSLTFLNDTAKRFKAAYEQDKLLRIIYFGDHDPSGDDIPNSIANNLQRFGIEVQIDRVALNRDQVIEWKLPAAPIKDGDSRSKNFTGIGQVELDAIEPKKLQSMCRDAIDKYFDDDLYTQLKEEQEEEKVTFVAELKKFVQTL